MIEFNADGHLKHQNCSLCVWDDQEKPDTNEDLTVFWKGSIGNVSENQVSIAQIVEASAEDLRSRFLAWVYDFGQAQIGNNRVVDILALRPGLSFWWMTSLAQQFNLGRFSGIDDIIKALALEKLLVDRNIETLHLYSANDQLAECLSTLCLKRDIRFEWSRCAKSKHVPAFSRLPNMIKALIYLIWYFFRAFPVVIRKPTAAVAGGTTFFDILVHLDSQALAKGIFVSNYWSDLVSKLEEWKVSCTWGHLFFRHQAVQSLSIARRLMDAFNFRAPSGQNHFLLESYLRPKLFFNAFYDYCRVVSAGWKIRSVKRPAIRHSRVDPWPLLRSEWGDALFGRECILNCLRISLFQEVMQAIPKQKMGFYIFENQPWEFALLHFWRAAGHGNIVGVPHTTQRFWDLRYHRDVRCYDREPEGFGFPVPDQLAVNGPLSAASLLSGGCPKELLVDVEALRYLHLENKSTVRKPKPLGLGLCVLICGESLADNNVHLFTWIKLVIPNMAENTSFIFKPHPAYPAHEQFLESLPIKVRHEPIHDLLKECDVMFVNGNSGAAVDAFCVGVPVVQMSDGAAFNTSSLRGVSGVTIVNSPEALAEALTNALNHEFLPPKLFNFDPELVRWRQLLGVEEALKQ